MQLVPSCQRRLSRGALSCTGQLKSFLLSKTCHSKDSIGFEPAMSVHPKAAEVVAAAENQDAVAFFREMAGFANINLSDVMLTPYWTHRSGL